MRYLKCGVKIVSVVAAMLSIIGVFAAYQPVRHVLYNNTKEVAQTWQQHYGKSIQAGGQADINGFFETPLMNVIVVGNKTFDPKIRFGENGEITGYHFGEGRNSFQLPVEWAEKRLLWKEYRYQLNEDGKLYLIKPGKTKAATDDQPENFPIILRAREAESNSSLNPDSQPRTAASRQVLRAG